MSLFRYFLLVVGIALVMASPLWSTKVTQNITKWSDTFHEKYNIIHTENNRFGLKDNWSGAVISNATIEVINNKVTSENAEINKKFTVESINGEILFTLDQNFLISRYTKHDLAFGNDINGIAYALFPVDTQKIDYVWWPSTLGSPINMKFLDEQIINQVRIYHFQGLATSIDDTSGYEFLPLVPEKYKVFSNVTVDAYVEPITGRVIDYKDQGVSYYSENNNRVWDISQWGNKYTEEIITRNSTRAKMQINLYSMHKKVIPLILLSLGGFTMYFSIFLLKKK